jgi:hypothetical protein
MGDEKPVGSYYERLGVPPDAPAQEVKRAFRRQMARYHPDKVQHLAQEFQDLAARRAAELTEAYRVLMDPAARAAYDEALKRGAEPPEPPRTASRAPDEPSQVSRGPAPPPPFAAEPTPAAADRAERREQPGDDLVRRAAIERLRGAILETLGGAELVAAAGFDLSCAAKRRRRLFDKAEPDLHLLARFVPRVDAGTVTETWPLAARVAAGTSAMTCVFLMGRTLASPPELAAAIAGHRRHWRARWPLTIVPVDVHDWEALVPKDAPSSVRRVIERLRRAS